MGRLNSRQRRERWRRVAWKELYLNTDLGPASYTNVGPYCRMCACRVIAHEKRDPKTKKVIPGQLPLGVIDCIDNSGDHDRLSNLQILCRSCNRKKNPKKDIPDDLPSGGDEHGRREMSFAARKNATVEPLFRAYVVSRLSDNGGQYDEDALIKAGAEKFKASIKSCTDYMDKLTSDEGPCQSIQGVVYCRDSRNMEEWYAAEDDDRRHAMRLYLKAKGHAPDRVDAAPLG